MTFFMFQDSYDDIPNNIPAPAGNNTFSLTSQISETDTEQCTCKRSESTVHRVYTVYPVVAQTLTPVLTS